MQRKLTRNAINSTRRVLPRYNYRSARRIQASSRIRPRRYVRAAGDIIKLEVTFEPYARYEDSRVVTRTISGHGLLDALKRMVDKMTLYLTSDEIDEENMTAEEVIDSIESSNGDGCDYIITLKNLTTGETYIEDYYEEGSEDWDEDFDSEEDW